MITLTTPLARIGGVSASLVTRFTRLGIVTVRDLLWHFPTRYDDFSNITLIASLEPGMSAVVRAEIKKVSVRHTFRRNMTIVEAIIADESGGMKALWFNQPYLAKSLRVGMTANFAGKISTSGNETYLASPAYEPMRPGGQTTHTSGLIPIYPETKGLTSRGIRYLVKPILQILPPITDPIPAHLLTPRKLPTLTQALHTIHFPKTLADAQKARERFSFEELFILQLANASRRAAIAAHAAPAMRILEGDMKELLSVIPFTLTKSQQQSLTETLTDLAKSQPMNRLLQGDVGSGKTVIAALAAIVAARAGYQAVFMAPTEILARQHEQTLTTLFSNVLLEWNIATDLIVGSLTPSVRKKKLAAVEQGKTLIAIGTHALIERTVTFKKLGLVIIDEQHRFGVDQRAALVRNDGAKENPTLPHLLSMSATPIPRTLSLALFGDLDLSTITELPAGRKPIDTKVVAPHERTSAYAFIHEKVKEGRQVFVICPRIERTEETKTLSEQKQLSLARWDDVKTVTEEFEKLSKEIFPDLRVAMLHGKIKAKEKEETMRKFKAGDTDILVSTSVIEVGVDVPNASVMVIEGAEFFGLAQLYQFRGRIGRGQHQSHCLLFTHNEGAGKARLTALLKAKNGFELAEYDLKLRGPGQFFGQQQTGLPDLAMSSLTDINLIKATRDAAMQLISKDPKLEYHPALLERLKQFEQSVHLE